MRILFIYDFAHRLGGVMTLISRLTNWLIERGHDVDVLVLAPRETASESVLELFSDKVRLHFVDVKYRYLPWYPLNLRGWAGKTFGDLDVIVAPSREALFVAASLYPAFKSQPVVIPYIIDTLAYTRTVKSAIADIIRKHFLEKIPDEFKMFVSYKVRDVHAESLKVKFDDSKILILPTKLTKARKAEMPEGRRIVSIARIDNAMKKYVFQLPEIVANLREKGFNVTCDIYGHGEDRIVSELHKIIRQHDGQDYVKYHGEVEYARFHEVLSVCFVFVGMGTSAIEAAMFGVPTIVAIAFSEWPKSYGYLTDYPVGALGEDLDREEALDIESMIADLCEIPEAEYLELCTQHVEYAKHYDQDEICLDMLAYFQQCLESEYRSFEMPLWRVLVINVVRGVNYLRRRLMLATTASPGAWIEGRKA